MYYDANDDDLDEHQHDSGNDDDDALHGNISVPSRSRGSPLLELYSKRKQQNIGLRQNSKYRWMNNSMSRANQSMFLQQQGPFRTATVLGLGDSSFRNKLSQNEFLLLHHASTTECQWAPHVPHMCPLIAVSTFKSTLPGVSSNRASAAGVRDVRRSEAVAMDGRQAVPEAGLGCCGVLLRHHALDLRGQQGRVSCHRPRSHYLVRLLCVLERGEFGLVSCCIRTALQNEPYQTCLSSRMV